MLQSDWLSYLSKKDVIIPWYFFFSAFFSFMNDNQYQPSFSIDAPITPSFKQMAIN